MTIENAANIFDLLTKKLSRYITFEIIECFYGRTATTRLILIQSWTVTIKK